MSSTPDRPVLILLQGGEGAAAQRTLERAGYQVLAVGEVAQKPVLKVLKPPRREPRRRRQDSAKSGRAALGMLMSASRAARLLRASPYAINRWQARGWLQRYDSSTRWRNLVDLREAVLLAWLHNGPECVSDELAELVQRPARAFRRADRCLARAADWRGALGDLAGSGFESAIQQVHEFGYSCQEIEACVARLAATASA